jgi:hypothetical protein
VLEYGNEVVLASEMAITNLLWSSSQKSQQPQTSASSVEPNISESTVGQMPAEPFDKLGAGQQQNTKAAAPDEKESVIATVKCDGPMIIRPTPAAESDDYKPPQFRNFLNLPDNTLRWLGRRNVLLAQRVSYDYVNQIAKAHGQVELVSYPEMEAYSKRKDKPFIISALTGAEFISELNQAIFYGSVKGSFNKQTDYYDEENIFYGDRLVVDLTAGLNKPESVESADIAHVTVTGPGVRLESIRTLGKTKLST